MKIQDITTAPIDSTPEFGRESALQPPDWRYQAACQYLDNEAKGQQNIPPSDPLVQFAIRSLRAYAYPSTRRILKETNPDIYAVVYFGTTARNTALANAMDACLIKELEYGEDVQAACGVSKAVYDLYAQLFFDLSRIRAVHAWIQDFLFEPARYNENTGTLRSHLMAYYGTTDAGLGVGITGSLLASEDPVLKQVIHNERQKKLFDYMTKYTKMDAETYAAVMEAAAKSMSEHDFQERMRDREEAGSSSLEELAEHMELGIRAFSQQELQAVGSSGQESTNQYIPILTGKHNDGKENITS